MKVIELLGDELEHFLNGKETMKWSKKLIMSRGTAKNRDMAVKREAETENIEEEMK